MRPIFAFLTLMLVATAAFAEPDVPDRRPIAADRDQASWAECEAQARITDGDYDGAVQAQLQADRDRHEVDRREMIARSSRR
jgi:hypothetical protein